MGASTVFVKCPIAGCPEIRNAAGLTRHIAHAHGVKTGAAAA